MSRPDVVIRRAQATDGAAVLGALRVLAADLGDPFRATPGTLAAALFGPARFARAHLATTQKGVPLGIVMANPQFSTVMGGAVTHVSDLWVSRAVRGHGLGRRLLEKAARDGMETWGARMLRLTVYADNAGAQDFYRALGFDLHPGEPTATLDTAAFMALMAET
jgi:ribosomal protein S18 acetylase RimI-like enzyme